MQNNDFLGSLKIEAKNIAALQREKIIPDQLSSLANFVARHTWEVLLLLAILMSLAWELIFYQGIYG